MISKAKWYLNRLATMSAGELIYRFRQLIQSNVEKYFCAGSKLSRIEIFCTAKILDVKLSDQHIFSPEIDVFGRILDYSEKEIDWHRDIFSNKLFPLIFSKNINIRTEPDLSAKNVWEINRLQFLPRVSLNYHLTGSKTYLDQFESIMNSWITHNPYMIGINWYSNLELNIRLINWFLCWEILDVSSLVEQDSSFAKFVSEKWIPSIHQHCEYSFNNPSRFSSANNHLIAEYAGLFIASSKWKFNDSGKWQLYAMRGLEKEIRLQHSNGINREEAAEYIQFITDFFLFSLVIGGKTYNSFSPGYIRTLKEIFEYILALVDMGGNIPNYGDGDDGKVVNLTTDKYFNNFLSLLTSASVLFKDQKFKLSKASWDQKNQVLFGEKGKEIFDSLTVSTEKRKSVFYKGEGHHIFREQKDGKEIFMHFNTAPLGYLSLAAHGHADALSVTLNINGHSIFVDPGTYSYHVSKEWRDYFVSTLAHNTICIDNQNQAKHAGDTIWHDHYRCSLISQHNGGFLESVKAEHNGYKKTKHIREVLFNRDDKSFTIQDEILKSEDNYQKCILLFHLHPQIKVEMLSRNHFSLIHPNGIILSVSIDDFSFISVFNGSKNPVLGWYSDSFMHNVPTNVLYAEKTINKTFKSKTKIVIHEY
jgi:hypothetical protein